VPSNGVCRYLRYWVAVKTRWHLTITGREKQALTKAGACGNPKLTIRLAHVAYK
jgi:hypothetical protein